MGDFMGLCRAICWTTAVALLMLATGCAHAPGQATPAVSPPSESKVPATAPSSSAPASQASASQGPTGQAQPSQGPTGQAQPSQGPTGQAQPSQAQPSQAAGGALQINTMPLGGSRIDVVARLPINAYWARPGQEINFDASSSEGVIGKYEWDLDGDGTYDTTTQSPILKHVYARPFEGVMILRVSNPLGSADILKTPVHVGTGPGPGGVRPVPPTNVKAEVVSADGTQVKVTWESNDPTADSWGVAVNGFPAGRVYKSARSVTVTDIQRDKDVLLQVFGITADGAVGDRAGTTLPAAK
ncbi:hypothetical protein ACVWYS_001182 [Arthrobacter sp. TE12231]